MSEIPLVSVIMPVYNGAEYLRPAIESILNQTFTNFEFIIINDGSKDNSREIIESYNDSRIVAVNQENMGVARSLNNGIKLARGKYIRRHDADDESLPDHIETQVNFIEKHPEFDLISDQIAYMTDRGKRALKFVNPREDFFQGRKWVDVDYDTYLKFRPVIHATILAKTKLIQELKGYRTEFVTSEDVDLWLRILDHHKIAVLNQCKYFVRLNATSITVRKKSSVNFYKNKAIEFASERREKGSDPLTRGEEMPKPVEEKAIEESAVKYPKGKFLRNDQEFYYMITINAKDCKNWRKTAWIILKGGWKLPATYRMLLFPLLGENMVKAGVSIKSRLKK